MAFTEDFTVFFDNDEFAIVATYTPCGYPHPTEITKNITGIFDKRYSDSEQMQGENLIFRCPTADVSNIEQGDKMTIEGAVYTVADWNNTADGVTDIMISEDDT